MNIFDIKYAIKQYGNISLEELLRREQGDRIYECPKCIGKGVTISYYDAYPKGLPDSGWVTDMREVRNPCDVCGGIGYTKHQLKPKVKTEIIGYE